MFLFILVFGYKGIKGLKENFNKKLLWMKIILLEVLIK